MAEEDQIIGGEAHQRMQQVSSRSPQKKVSFQLPSATAIIIAVVLGVLGFLGGAQYQKHHTKAASTATTTSQGAGFSQGGSGGFSRRGNGGIGQVTAITSTSITVADQRSGSSKTYAITSSTTITDNGQTATVSDIQTGDTVLVSTSSSDTSTATRILINPSFGGGFGGQGSSSSGDTTQ